MKSPDDSTGFDPNAYLADKAPAFDPNSYLASKEPQGFDPDSYIQGKTAERVQQLTSDPKFDPASYAAQTGDTETAFQAREALRNRTFGEKAGAFGEALTEPETYANAAKGIGKFALGLAAAPLHTLAQAAATIGAPIAGAIGADNLQHTLENEQQTQGAEATLAGQQIEQSVRGIGRGIRNTAENLTGTDQDEATQRAHFADEIQAAKNAQQLAQSRPLDTGLVASAAQAATGAPNLSDVYSPEALQAQGARPVSPLLTESMAAAADPTNLAIPLAGEIPGVKTLAGGIVQAGGKLLQVPESIMSVVPRINRLSHGGGLAYGVMAHPAAAIPAAGAFGLGKVLGWAGRALDEQGAAMRTGIPSALDQTAQQALTAAQSAIGTNAQRVIGNTAGNIVATSLGFAPLNYAMSGGDPRQFAQSEVGAGAMGGIFGLAGERGRMEDIANYRLAQYGAQQFTDNPMWAAHQATMGTFSPADQQAINALRGTLYGGTGADVLVLDGPSFAKQVGQIGGDARGQYAWDDKTIYLNADAIGKTPAEKAGGALDTAGHETGHAVVDFLKNAGREADAQGMLSSIASAMTPEQTQAMADDYHGRLLASTDTTGKPPAEIDAIKQQIAADNPPNQIIEENLAEITRRILSGKSIAGFAIPKPILDRVMDSAARWMEARGWSPKVDEGATLGFKAQMVKDAARRMTDVLYETGKRASAVAGAGQTEGQRLIKAQNDLANIPPITPDMPAAKAAAIRRQQADAQKVVDEIQGKTSQPTPAGTTPAGVVNNTPATAPLNRYRVAAILRKNGLPADEAQQWAQGATGATDEEAVANVLRERNQPTTPQPTQTTASTPTVMTRQMEQQLADLGYSKAERNSMKPGDAMEIIKAGVSKPKAAPSSPPEEIAAQERTLAEAPEAVKPIPPEPQPAPDERPIPAPQASESLPSSDGGARTGDGGNTTTVKPVEVSTKDVEGTTPTEVVHTKEDLDAIAAKARTEFLADKAPAKSGKNKGQHTAENQKLADKAAFDAAAEAHAETVPANYGGMKQRVDAFGKKTVSGNLDPSRPFDSWLIDQAQKAGNLPQGVLETMLSLQDAIGKTVTFDYGHAPTSEEGEQPTKETRAGQQAKYSAQKRISGEAPTQTEAKTSIPLGIQFNSGNKSFNVFGASPEKLLNNFNHLKDAYDTAGIPFPYKDINDPQFVADFKGVIRNHQNGWFGDGSRPAVGTAEYPNTANPDWATSPERAVIPENRFDFINMMLGDEGAKASTPQAKAKANLANENRTLINEAGETNETRQTLNDAIGPQTDKNGNPSTWSKITLEDPLSENLSPALASNVRPADQTDASIRQHGKVGDLGRFFQGGNTPNRAKTAAGFMPIDEGDKLWRAADDPIARTGAHFSTNENDATAYQDNPGFGGKNVNQYSVDLSHVADAPTLRDLSSKLEPLLSEDQKEWAESHGGLESAIRGYGFDHVFHALENVFGPRGNRIDPVELLAKDHDWIKFKDDFPEGADTYKYIGKTPLNPIEGASDSPNKGRPLASVAGRVARENESTLGNASKAVNGFMPDTGAPEDGDTPAERLAREAEQAGVVLRVDQLKGLIQGDKTVMDKVRERIQQQTGQPAKFLPNAEPFTPSPSDKNAIDIGEPDWIQRFQTLMHKEDSGKLSGADEDELDALHKKLDAEYPGGSKAFLKRYEGSFLPATPQPSPPTSKRPARQPMPAAVLRGNPSSQDTRQKRDIKGLIRERMAA